ncbi:MAG: glycoside hydrolase family 1 protein [Bdellovibrionales bacterium]|nr:glycoside hydrolase family 1 protein [Bdellovibrionales bacterium]
MTIEVARILVFFALNPFAHAAKPKTIVFPKDFKWCTATAGHQIEGNNVHSDWWEFEKQPGAISGGQKSGLAAGSYTRVSEDIALMKSIGANSYRFSVEWSRVEPKEGVIDAAEVKHYQDQVLQLEAAGIEPLITLHHFVSPLWFRNKGGWEWEGAPKAFADFARLVRSKIAPKARFFITINEPMVHIMGGYFLGNVPPQEKRPMQDIAPVLIGLLKSHAAAYAALKEEAKKSKTEVQVGTANHLRLFQAKRKLNPVDQLTAQILEDAWNWAFPNALKTGRLKMKIPQMVSIDVEIQGLRGTQDYLGINYYTRDRIHSGAVMRAAKGKPKPSDGDFLERMYSPANWESYPDGLEKILKQAYRKYSLPILITENGVDDATDLKRQDYLRTHVQAVARAIDSGVPVQSYCHWSLLDNFEWIHGFGPRFGLFEVDYSTLNRRARPSAELFKNFATQNSIRR